MSDSGPAGGAGPRVAVFLMALGGPDSLDNVEPYLLDLRGGRATPPELVEEIRERYRATGGRSPVLDITRELAAKLEARRPVKVFVGLRHWHPFIAEAWAEVIEYAPERVVGICLAPQYSAMTVGKYVEMLADARTEVGGGELPLSTVRSWATHPGLVAALAERIDQALRRFPEGERAAVPVLFTAHSLPERILRDGDAYPDEVRATMEAVIVRLPAGQPTAFAFQSQGRSPEPWLGPEVEPTLDRLAAGGVPGVVIAPIGFLSDHVETLYDIDIEFRARADKLGLRLERMAMLNASDALADTLAALVDEQLSG
ncbi:MAG: protoporphyrin/coproporphyrin ferrochelatase [Actinomycetota bacterium]|nr:protoporphyrin/coproporphyrin ferrochelatase [Actinomycetota bacterium]